MENKNLRLSAPYAIIARHFGDHAQYLDPLEYLKS